MRIFSFCPLKEVEDIVLPLRYGAYTETSFKDHNMERMPRVWKLTHCSTRQAVKVHTNNG